MLVRFLPPMGGYSRARRRPAHRKSDSAPSGNRLHLEGPMRPAVIKHQTLAPELPSTVQRGITPIGAPDFPMPAIPAELVVELAHDLRSPLTSIMSLAEHMQGGGGGPVTDTQRRQLSIIYSAALCLSQTASGVVELGRGGAGSEYDCPGPFSLTELFAGTQLMVAPMAEEKGLELRMNVAVEDWRVGPVGTLGRVLLNLTTNALKFTEEGVVELTASSVGPGTIELAVRDTGPGLEPHLMRTLFQPFPVADAPAPRRYFSSTGLGLALCRKLVAALGSELQVESRPRAGTRFYFRLELPEVARSSRFGRPEFHLSTRTA